MPYRDEDIAAWPIKRADLEPHYKAVLDFMAHSIETDSLAEHFPSIRSVPDVSVIPVEVENRVVFSSERTELLFVNSTRLLSAIGGS